MSSLYSLHAFNPSSSGIRRCVFHQPSSIHVTRPHVARARVSCRASSSLKEFEGFILETQESILRSAEHLDGSGQVFVEDKWSRPGGEKNAGYGITSVLEGGSLLEKAAANVSIIQGVLSPARAQAMSGRGRSNIDPNGGQPYAAAALSLVFHSAHPHVPTLRADVRFFQVGEESWYGGGCDLTPFYIYPEDASSFHQYWKQVCDKYDSKVYPDFKAWCDRYFYIPARKEHRGIGGIFFDDLSQSEQQFDVDAFTREVAQGILPSWQEIAQTRRQIQFTPEERNWQLLRRGRYLEFNLLYDRGVKFGLDGGRVESIMVSAPPLVAWKYNVIPQARSREEELVGVLQAPREWV